MIGNPDTGNTILFWQQWGHSNKKPLLLLHGFLGAATDWQYVGGMDGYCFYCPDLPGHGASISMQALNLKDIAEVADAIISDMDTLGLSKIPVLGYSMGGRVALHLALRYPQRFSALVLESASPGIKNPEERTQRFLNDCALAQRLHDMDCNREAFQNFLNEWYAMPIFHKMKSQTNFIELLDMRRDMGSEHVGDALEIMSIGKQKNLWEELHTLSVPTLLIAGMEDRKYRQIAEKMAEANPEIAVQLFADCGHNVHWQNPSGYTTAVNAFLARTCPF